MTLRSSDKIIAIIGVIIIIVAVIGIYLYDEPEKEMIPVEPEEKAYYVTWANMTDDFTNKGEAEKKTDYKKTLTVDAPENSVLTDVEFQLNWKDDKVYGLGKNKKGYDTLTINIKLDDKTQKKSSNSGKITIPFIVNNVPTDDYVDAGDENEAYDLIDGMYLGLNEATFEVTVTVDPGEKIFRPLKFLRDKGNNFELTITYDYYTYELEKPDGPVEPSEEENTVTSTVITTSSNGRDWF